MLQPPEAEAHVLAHTDDFRTYVRIEHSHLVMLRRAVFFLVALERPEIYNPVAFDVSSPVAKQRLPTPLMGS
ncbi:hypothetical protein WS87_12730 [Burkholderia sp. MSMB0856]|nr:hypothetical protein WS87_12730 [Burkholderia sp. MSMB0856]KVH30980.1 hypothetical protein WS87_26715 [Burkholderia sp. MSMB0856]